MRISFSTLACPDWTMPQIIATAAREGYDGIELRFVQGEDSLWKLPVFSGAQLADTKRALADLGLTISCMDTSCRFDSPDSTERQRWIDEGKRMAELAAELVAPGLRLFGDTIQPGADRTSTQSWIADSIRSLAETTAQTGVGVWLENHGSFVASAQTAAILAETACSTTGVVWDPVNSFASCSEQPAQGASLLGNAIRHVHLKDLKRQRDEWKYTLTGEGEFPLLAVKEALEQLKYDQFVSFEWERKWHPSIEDPEIALPHFARWFRESWAHG